MHPLWVIKNDKFIQTNFKPIISDLERKLIVPDFIEVKNVKENDFVGFPIPKWEQDIVHYTEADCRMYGIFVGDGHLTANKNQCSITINAEKKDTIAFIESYLHTLGINPVHSGKGRNARIEGLMSEGQNVLLVEDLTTDGGSKLSFVDAIRDTGAACAHTAVIFYYGIFEETEKTLSDHGVGLHYLCTWWDVLREAKAQSAFDSKTLHEVEQFLTDPRAWQNGRKST